MATKILYDVLEQTVGRYVQQLDPNQLNVAIWSGKIDLFDVNVNAAAVNREIQDLPISILQGSIGSLQVIIPWAHLASKPVRIQIQSVRLISQPKHVKVSENNMENEEKQRVEALEQAEQFRQTIQKLSEGNNNDNDDGHDDVGDDKGRDSFTARLMRRVLENIHIEVHDVHIVLQHDSLSTIGLCWEKFTVCTTNEDGIPTFIDRTVKNSSNALCKQVQLSKFGIYMDQQPKQLRHEYFLTPITFKCIIRQLDTDHWKKQDTKQPRYHIASTISSVFVGISKHQVTTLPSVIESLLPEEPVIPILFPEYRPNKSVKQDAKLWWKYAYRCVGRIAGRTSWREYFLAFKRRKVYIKLYQRKKVQQDENLTVKREPLSEIEKNELESMDHDQTIPVEAIMKWRSLAETELNLEQKKIQDKQPKDKPKSKSGRGRWWRRGKKKKSNNDDGGTTDEADDNDNEAFLIELSGEELQKLESFTLMSNDKNDEALQQYQLYSMQFVLESFRIQLIADVKLNHRLLQIDMGKVNVNFNSLVNGAFSFNYKLSDMSVSDLVTTNSLYPKIVTSAATANKVKALFEIFVEKTKSGDQSLNIRLEPIEVIASPKLVQALMKFTKKEIVEGLKQDKEGNRNSKRVLEKAVVAAKEQTVEVVSSKVTELSNSLLEAWTAKTKSKQVWSLTVDWHSPIVLIPQSCVDKNATMIVVNSGTFNIQYGSNKPMVQYIQNWYKKYPAPKALLGVAMLESGSVSVSDLAVIVSTNQLYLTKQHTTSRIMDPISMTMDFGMETVTGRALPRLCLLGEIPSFTIRVSSLLGSKVLGVANTWTTYLSDKPITTNDPAKPDILLDKAENESIHFLAKPQPNQTKSTSPTAVPDTAVIQELLSHVLIQTNDCQVILVDEEEQNMEDESKRIKFLAPISNALSDSIVCKGKFELSMTTGVDAKTGQIVSAKVMTSGEDMEVYSAVGQALEYPLQILGPFKLSILVNQKGSSLKGQCIDALVETSAPIDIILSTHNLVLMNDIVSDLSKFFVAGAESNNLPKNEITLNDAESQHIQKFSEKLQSSETALLRENENVVVDQNENSPHELDNKKGESLNKITLKLTMSQTTLTVINDLHGFDEALFRVVVDSIQVNCDVTQQENVLLFTLQHNASIMADYFDPVKYKWNPLLTKPWELKLQMSRVPVTNEESKRFHTSFDFESFPCHVSFSDQFIMNLANATRSWSIYNSSVTSAMEELAADKGRDAKIVAENQRFMNRAMRNLLITLPFAVENHSGIDTKIKILDAVPKSFDCKNGSTGYFRFSPPAGKGVGARRSYGQNVTKKRGVELYFGQDEHKVDAQYLDAGAKEGKQVIELPDGSTIFSSISRDVGGATTILHLYSCVEVYNQTSVPFKISVMDGEVAKDAGTCEPTRVLSIPLATDTLRPLSICNGQVSRPSKGFSIPAPLLKNFTKDWATNGVGTLSIVISPIFEAKRYEGIVFLEPNCELIKKSGGSLSTRVGVVCTSKADEGRTSKFHVQVSVEMSLVDKKFLALSVSLQPRAIIESKVPVAVVVKTPVSLTTSSSTQESGGEILHQLNQGSQVEIFSPETSIAIKVNAIKGQVGNDDDVVRGGWFTLPLDTEEHPPEPLTCYFAESGKKSDSLSPSDIFFIAEGVRKLDRQTANDDLRSGVTENIDVQALANPSLVDIVRTYFVSVRFYAVDHVGDVQFECQKVSGQGFDILKSLTQGSSASEHGGVVLLPTYDTSSDDNNNKKITLLTTSSIPLRLLKQTEHGSQMMKSKSFVIEDVAIGEGGIETTPLTWEDDSSSGYYAFRRLLNSTQSEIHIISEFVLFNGSKDALRVRSKSNSAKEVTVEQENITSLQSSVQQGCVEFYIDFVGGKCSTPLIKVNDLGLKMAVVYSSTEKPIGSVPIQTAIDDKGNSRLVIKVGELQLGSLDIRDNNQFGMFQNDKISANIHLKEFRLTLNKSNKENMKPIAIFMLSDFLGSFNRDFELAVGEKQVKDRTQLSMAVKSLQIQDEAANATDKNVLSCNAQDVNFLDLSICVQGTVDADLIHVDRFDLNLAHKDGTTKQIIVNASESFVWQLLDVGNQISNAADANEGFMPKFVKSNNDPMYYNVAIVPSEGAGNREPEYAAPRIETLYDLALARVSAFTVIVSFKRNPDASRYQLVEKGYGASMMNYFTRELKFTIDKAPLSFAKYEGKDLKGPPNRLIEILSAVYISRMKYKMFTLLSATSLQDWKNLAGRQGEDEFVNGDVLRATGNLAGSTADLLFKNVGQGLGGGVAKITSTLGDGIEKTTSIVGVQRIGAGVNSVVSGVGDGVGSTITGVGTGTGQVLKGVGLGAGQVLGSVGGGIISIGEDVGKGIVTGDGKAIATGLTRNVGAVGSGVSGGVGVAASATADGVLSAGQGLVSGISNVGKGLTGVFTGKPKSK